MAKTFIVSEKQALRAISACCESGWRVQGTVRVAGVVTAITLVRGADMVQVFTHDRRLVLTSASMERAYQRSGSGLFMNTKKGAGSWKRFLAWCNGGI